MIITNKHALPAPLVRAITFDQQKREGFTVTNLINSPRITQLQRRRWDEIAEDASERIWPLLGSAVHYILAKGTTAEALKEERLEIEVGGVKVRGRPDLWQENIITDYKLTSVWNIVLEPRGRREWHCQLNLYNALYSHAGFPAQKLEVCAILRDWQESKRGEHNYPAIQVVMIGIPIWDEETTMNYLRERVRLHLEAERLADDELPLCTPEEMWEKPTTYAAVSYTHLTLPTTPYV